jgi:hypothetical protein
MTSVVGIADSNVTASLHYGTDMLKEHQRQDFAIYLHDRPALRE